MNGRALGISWEHFANEAKLQRFYGDSSVSEMYEISVFPLLLGILVRETKHMYKEYGEMIMMVVCIRSLQLR